MTPRQSGNKRPSPLGGRGTPGFSDPAGQIRAAGRGLRGCLAGLLLLCLLAPAFVALCYAFDALFDAPWAYPLLGRPTLTGIWVAEFTVPSGTRFALLLDLRRQVLSSGTLHADEAVDPLISGQASWCDDHGRGAQAIPLEGQVPLLSGFQGSISQVEIDLESAKHPQPGLQPAYFQGGWDVDTLTLKPNYIYWDEQAQAMVSSSDNPDFASPPAVVLKKSDEAAFRAACAELGQVPP